MQNQMAGVGFSAILGIFLLSTIGKSMQICLKLTVSTL